MAPLPRIEGQSGQSRNLYAVQDAQPQQVQQSQQAQRTSTSGINAEVRQARSLPAQAPRRQPSPALLKLCLIGKMILSTFTFGFSDKLISAVITPRLLRAAQARLQPTSAQPQPAPATNQYNRGIGQMILNGQALPESLQAGADQGLEQLRSTWGEASGAGETLATSSDGLKSQVNRAVSQLEDDVDAQALEESFVHGGANLAKDAIMQRALQSVMQEEGYATRTVLSSCTEGMLNALPELKAAVDAATTPTELDHAIATSLHDIQSYVTFMKEKDGVAALAKDLAVTRLSENLGMSEEQIRTKVNFKNLTDSLNCITSSLQYGTSMETAVTTSMQAAEKFAEKLTDLYYTADTMPVSDELRTYTQDQVLKGTSFPTPNFFTQTLDAATRMMGPKTNAIRRLFANGKTPDTKALFNAFKALSTVLERTINAEFGAARARFGRDELSTAQFYILKCLFDKMPEVRDALRANPDLCDAVDDRAFETQLAASTRNDQTTARQCAAIKVMVIALGNTSQSNAKLADGLARPNDLPAAYLVALEQVKIEIGIAHPHVKIDELMTPENLGVLQRAVVSAEEDLSAAAFAARIREALIQSLPAAPQAEESLQIEV